MAQKLNVNTSVVDYLKSQGKDSSISARGVLAKGYGINNYTGSFDQNVQLMNLLKSQASKVAPKPATPTAPKPTTPASPTKTTTPTNPTNNSSVNAIFDKQKQAQMAQLKLTRDKAIGEINAQKEKVAPEYQKLRNQSDVVSMQNVNRLRELMASNGLTASGENVTANVAMNNARQTALNELSTQEQGLVNDYDRQIMGINNPQEETALIAQLEAQRAQALYDDMWKNKQFDFEQQRYADDKAWREYTFNNMSAAQKKQFAQDASQFGEEMAWRKYALDHEGELQKSLAQTQISGYTSGFKSTSGGGGYSNLYKTSQANGSANYSTFQKHIQQATAMGLPKAWIPALTELVGRESSWNPSAKNPNSTAHGYGQFLNSTRSNYEKKMGLNYDNPVHQLVMMGQYVQDRYGTPEKALAFWDKNKWY